MNDPMEKFEELLQELVRDCVAHGFSSAHYNNAVEENEKEAAAKDSADALRDFVRELVEKAK